MEKFFTALSLKIFLLLIACRFCFFSMAQENSKPASSLSSSVSDIILSSGWIWVGIAIAFSLLLYLFKKKGSGDNSREKFFRSSGIFDVE